MNQFPAGERDVGPDRVSTPLAGRDDDRCLLLLPALLVNVIVVIGAIVIWASIVQWWFR